MELIDNLKKQISYAQALVQAYEAVEIGKAVKEDAPVEKESVEAQKTTAQNIALAGSGDKAALLGTLSTAPTLTAKALVDIGVDEKQADEMIIAAATVRADALALTLSVKP